MYSEEPIRLGPYQIHQQGQGYELECRGGKFSLSQLQFQYLDYLLQRKSIRELVRFNLEQGWLVHFRSLLDLLNGLISLHLLKNHKVESALTTAALPSWPGQLYLTIKTFFSHQSVSDHYDVNQLNQLAFFRSLQPELRKYLLGKVQILPALRNMRLLKNGDRSRDLFILIEGEAGVFTDQLVARIPAGTVFGEGGFLLGKPRSANVYALSMCLVGRIAFDKKIEEMIQPEKAESLQQRFWVLHALLKSEIFKKVSSEALDRFIFLGQLKDVKSGEDIIREGEIGKSFFIIIQGNIDFFQHGRKIRTLTQGDIFGEVALMLTSGLRTATARASEKSLLLEIGQAEFFQALADDLILAVEIEKMAHARVTSTIS